MAARAWPARGRGGAAHGLPLALGTHRRTAPRAVDSDHFSIVARRCTRARRRGWRLVFPHASQSVRPGRHRAMGLPRRAGRLAHHVPPFADRHRTGHRQHSCLAPRVRNPSLWRIPPRTLALGCTACLRSTSCCSSRCAMRRPWRPIWSTTCGRCSSWCWHPWCCPAWHCACRMCWPPCWALAEPPGYRRGRELSGTLAWGYLPALMSAFIWATYSLLTKRVPPSRPPPLACSGWCRACSRCCAMHCSNHGVAAGARLGLAHLLGLGPLGGLVLSVGQGAQAGRRTAHWHPELPLRWRQPRCSSW